MSEECFAAFNVQKNDFRGASVMLFENAQAVLDVLIAAVKAEPVDLEAVARALDDFKVFHESGVEALHRYADISDCAGSG